MTIEERAKAALSQSVEEMAVNDESLVGSAYAYMPQSVANASNNVIAFPSSVDQSGIIDLNLNTLAGDRLKRKVFIRSVRYQSKDCSQSSSDETRGLREDSIDTNRQKLFSIVTTPSTQ